MNSSYCLKNRQAPVLSCIACGTLPKLSALARVIISPSGAPPAVVCGPCSQRADADPQHRRALEVCAASGVPFKAIKRLFVQLGVFEVPTTLEGIDDAVGLPAGSAAAAAAALRGGR